MNRIFTSYKSLIISLASLLVSFSGLSAQDSGQSGSDKKLPPQVITAWQIIQPLGLREQVPVDTLLHNYYLQAVPNDASLAYATTGNLGTEGINMIYMDRKKNSPFFFRDALSFWLPEEGNHTFYNSHIPLTFVSYNTGGGKESTQDRLKVNFSGNVNKRLQIGANLDYLYSKGSYANQAAKDLTWGASTSYIGDRYDLQAFFYHFNALNKENGGITDDRFITDPAVMQGGVASIEPKSIPVNLTDAHSRLVGQEFMMNHRYKFGFWRDLPPDTTKTEPDTIPRREYVPVSSVVWTFNYNGGRHHFINSNIENDRDFWKNTYLNTEGTRDLTKYHSISNTIGLALHEGFHKYAKFGISAFLTYEMRKYTQNPDTILDLETVPEILTPYPYESRIPMKATENLVWVGGQITKQQGSLLRYEATAKFGLSGRAAGEIDLNGIVSTSIPLLGDTLNVNADGRFSNLAPSYLLENYVSNHFIWHNSFGKTRKLRLGGSICFPKTRTAISAHVENVQNLVYFDSLACPVQHGGSVQVLSLGLTQNFKVGILNWQNRIVYQTSSDQSVLPLPKFAAFSNLFLLFKVAKVLDVQMGVDCDYYSKYYAPDYQPATMSFCNQDKIKCGGYPFMNAYVNMKLSKTRFYILFAHINQGSIGGNDYFSLPHYPMNPRRFQIGLSVDFSN
ncbi:MAG: putative porin [Muribaculaceae bacterium]|nr:putative porin [Muribaculaceae bacterium]